MKQFEAIRDSGIFWIAVGVLSLVCIAIGKREKPRLRGSGKFAGKTQMIRKYGDWSRFPLSLFAVLLIYAFLVPITAALLYSIWGWDGFTGRVWMTTILVELFPIAIFLYVAVFLDRFKKINRYPFGEIRYLGLKVTLWLPEKDRFEHIKIQGRAGVGKTTGFMFPGLISDAAGECSAVALDVKSPELFETVAGSWSARGKKVILWDPYHPDCIGFEPLATADPNGLSRIEESVYGKRNTGADPQSVFFDDQERRLFRLCCRLVQSYKDPAQCNLPMVHQLALRGAPAIEAAVTYCHNPLLQEEFNHLFNNRQRVPDLIGGMLNKLDPFSDPKIAAGFSRPDLDLDILFREPTLLIIASPQSNPKSRLGAAILLRSVMLKIFERPTRGEGLPIFFYLDEFYNLHLPEMPDFVNTARSTRTGVITFLQTHEQLYQYKRHEIGSLSINQKVQIYLQGCDIVHCEELSKRLGKTLIKDKRVSGGFGGRRHTTVSYIEVPLMTADAIQMLPADDALCFPGDMRPFLVKRLFSYKTPEFKKKTCLPASAYRPCTEPLSAPSYKDLDLPGPESFTPSNAASPRLPGAPGGKEVPGW